MIKYKYYHLRRSLLLLGQALEPLLEHVQELQVLARVPVDVGPALRLQLHRVAHLEASLPRRVDAGQLGDAARLRAHLLVRGLARQVGLEGLVGGAVVGDVEAHGLRTPALDFEFGVAVHRQYFGVDGVAFDRVLLV